MNVLLPVFLAVLLGESGSKAQRLSRALGQGNHHATILAAILISSLFSYGLAAAGGLLIGRSIPEEARLLLAGLSLAFAGAPMLWPAKPKPIEAGTRGFAGMATRFTIAQFGDGAQFIVFAFAAYAMSPVLALAGGLLGVLAATFIQLAADRMGIRFQAGTATRIGAGLLLLFAGGWLAVSALGIG